LLDRTVAWLSRNSRLFSRGWGDEEMLDDPSARRRYLAAPERVAIQWDIEGREGDSRVRDGCFRSPVEALPEPAAMAHVRAYVRSKNGAACVVLAASRDEGYWARKQLFGALNGRGIDLYFLENPFYGLRRCEGGPSEVSVSEHGLMALSMVLEARALLDHLKPQYDKLAVAGYSMGGHMAALTAAVYPVPVACAALATGASAGAIYTRGLLSRSVDFAALGGNGARDRLQELFEVADITTYRPPVRVDAAVISGSRQDGYVLASETERLHRHWEGSTLHWVDAGHFSALITRRRMLRDCVEEALEKL
jgi:pimeloyl-ACP methyl ester carboxylesterase